MRSCASGCRSRKPEQNGEYQREFSKKGVWGGQELYIRRLNLSERKFPLFSKAIFMYDKGLVLA
jgi:hypothetical protein